MAKKKGKGKGINYSSPYGDGVDWDIDDYLPVWELPEGDTLDPTAPLSFNADLQGRSQLFLPLHVNNDGIGNDTDGFNTITLSLDPTDTVGFTQETYVLKESWDASLVMFPQNSIDFLILDQSNWQITCQRHFYQWGNNSHA